MTNSNFLNINAYTQVTSLAAYFGTNPLITISKNVYQPFSVPAFIHKGIALNIEGFGGQVEFQGNIFTRNMHFIPAIYYKY